MKKAVLFTLVLTVALLAGCTNNSNQRHAVTPAKMAPAKVYNATCTHQFDACHVKADAECKKMGYTGHSTVSQDNGFFGNNIDYSCTR